MALDIHVTNAFLLERIASCGAERASGNTVQYSYSFNSYSFIRSSGTIQPRKQREFNAGEEKHTIVTRKQKNGNRKKAQKHELFP
jgi:hypothetical protein